MKYCPTLRRLLELERDAWYGKDSGPNKGARWAAWSQAVSDLLHREDLENVLLEEFAEWSFDEEGSGGSEQEYPSFGS